MSALVGLKTDSWDLNKGKIEWVDTWPMMSSPGPMAMVLAVYLLFVLCVGPAYMEKRSPYQLKWTLVLYNAVQVLFSVFLAGKCLLVVMRNGLVHSECLMNRYDTQLAVADCTWWYFVAKVTEFLDTVFFVLRKKDAQVTFLHVYHHCTMMAGTWVVLKYGPTDHIMFQAFLNSTVHVVMYSYYGLAALGPEYAKYIWWKKYLTRIQLIQFATAATVLYAQVSVSDCPIQKSLYYFFMFTLFMFFYLFTDFYRKEFLKNGMNSRDRMSKGRLYSRSDKSEMCSKIERMKCQ